MQTTSTITQHHPTDVKVHGHGAHLKTGEELRRALQPTYAIESFDRSAVFGDGWHAFRKTDGRSCFVRLVTVKDRSHLGDLKHATRCNHFALITPAEVLDCGDLGTAFIFDQLSDDTKSLRRMLQDLPAPPPEDVIGSVFAPLVLGLFHLQTHDALFPDTRLDPTTVLVAGDGTVRAVINPLLAKKEVAYKHDKLEKQRKQIARQQTKLEKHRRSMVKRHDALLQEQRELEGKHDRLERERGQLERKYEEQEGAYNDLERRDHSAGHQQQHGGGGALADAQLAPASAPPGHQQHATRDPTLRELEQDQARIKQGHERAAKQHEAMVKFHQRLVHNFQTFEAHHAQLRAQHEQLDAERGGLERLCAEAGRDAQAQRGLRERFVIADLALILFELCKRKQVDHASKAALKSAKYLHNSRGYSIELQALLVAMLQTARLEEDAKEAKHGKQHTAATAPAILTLQDLLRHDLVRRWAQQLFVEVQLNNLMPPAVRDQYAHDVRSQLALVNQLPRDATPGSAGSLDDHIDDRGGAALSYATSSLPKQHGAIDAPPLREGPVARG